MCPSSEELQFLGRRIGTAAYAEGLVPRCPRCPAKHACTLAPVKEGTGGGRNFASHGGVGKIMGFFRWANMGKRIIVKGKDGKMWGKKLETSWFRWENHRSPRGLKWRILQPCWSTVKWHVGSTWWHQFQQRTGYLRLISMLLMLLRCTSWVLVDLWMVCIIKV